MNVTNTTDIVQPLHFTVTDHRFNLTTDTQAKMTRNVCFTFQHCNCFLCSCNAFFYHCKSMPLVRRGLTSCFFLCCGVISKLTLLLVLAAPVKRKGARGEVRFPETPLLRALFYLKGPAPCCYWLAVTCLSAVVCLSLKAVLSRLVTVL